MQPDQNKFPERTMDTNTHTLSHDEIRHIGVRRTRPTREDLQRQRERFHQHIQRSLDNIEAQIRNIDRVIAEEAARTLALWNEQASYQASEFGIRMARQEHILREFRRRWEEAERSRSALQRSLASFDRRREANGDVLDRRSASAEAAATPADVVEQ